MTDTHKTQILLAENAAVIAHLTHLATRQKPKSGRKYPVPTLPDPTRLNSWLTRPILWKSIRAA